MLLHAHRKALIYNPRKRDRKRKDDGTERRYQILGAKDAVHAWSIKLSQNAKRLPQALMHQGKGALTSTKQESLQLA